MWWTQRRPEPGEQRGRRMVGLLTMVVILGAAATGAGAAHSGPVSGLGDPDIRLLAPIPVEGELGPAAGDPLGLVAGYEVNRSYALGVDHLDVWLCGDVGQRLDEVVDRLGAVAGSHLEHLSGGRYRPIFRAAGTRSTLAECQAAAERLPGPDAEGALFIVPDTGGSAGPGVWCLSGDQVLVCPDKQTWPANERSGRIGWASHPDVLAAHELGHMIHWPHINTLGGGDVYDVANDLMSRNLGSGRPYQTNALNRYAAGWIDAGDVTIVGGGGDQIRLTTVDGDGTQMAVIPSADGSLFVLGARVRSEWDDIPIAWEGVEVSRAEVCLDGCLGFRKMWPVPNVPSGDAALDQELPHVIGVGDARTIGGVTVEVTDPIDHGFLVRFRDGAGVSPTGPSTTVVTTPFPETTTTVVSVTTHPTGEDPPLGLRFVDLDGPFTDDVLWIAVQGITRGCNPPTNDRFCPDSAVTRGAMAAFLDRALGLPDAPQAPFVDTGRSVFGDDIDRLAAAGITRGCNPPSNSRFCPEESVTRAQMAAFLRRALEAQVESLPGSTFVDVDGSVFESDINWLAGAGITRGCNPPDNDRYCPDDPVTRAEMAAFLRRALAGD